MSTQEKQSLSASQPVTDVAIGNDSIIRCKERVAIVGTLAGVEIVVKTKTFNQFTALSIQARAVKFDAPADLPAIVLDPDNHDVADVVGLHVPGIRRGELIDRIKDLAEFALGAGHIESTENEKRSVAVTPVADPTKGAMLVTDVRFTRIEEGVCLVAVRSPLVGWMNVIQAKADDLMHSVNLAQVHGAA